MPQSYQLNEQASQKIVVSIKDGHFCVGKEIMFHLAKSDGVKSSSLPSTNWDKDITPHILGLFLTTFEPFRFPLIASTAIKMGIIYLNQKTVLKII